MQKSIGKIMRVEPGEMGIVLVLGGILFANYAAMGITKVVAVTGFLSEVRDQYILLVWAVDMLLLILATGLQSLIVDRFNRIKLIVAILLVFAGLYVVMPLLFMLNFIPKVVNYTLIYLLNDQQWRFFPVVFWVLAADIFSPAQSRRLGPVVANFAFIGTVVGLGVAALDAGAHFGTIALLLLNAAIFLLATALAYFGLRRVDIRPAFRRSETMRETLVEGWTFIKEVPAYRYLALGMLATGAAMTVLLFDVLSDAHLALGTGFQAFYSQYNLLIAFASVIVQALTSRIMEKLTLRNTFLIQPILMLAGTISALGFGGSPLGGVASSSLGQGVSRVGYDTTDLSARKAFEALVPEERRGRVSLFIDSYVPSAGTIIGSLVAFGIISGGLALGLSRDLYSGVYMGLGIAVAGVSLWAVLRMRQVYEQSLLNWQLKRRQRRSSVLDKLDFSE